jgi:hypothetical protein
MVSETLYCCCSIEVHVLITGLTPEFTHPVQRDAFLGAYKFLLDEGVQPESIVFMGE